MAGLSGLWPWFLLLALDGLSGGEAARILLMPTLHYSHVNLFATNGRALQDAGHDVMMLTSPQLKGPVSKHGLRPIINPISKAADFTLQSYKNGTNIFVDSSFLKKLNEMRPIFLKLCEETNANTMLMTFLADQKFDLVMIDGMALRHCMYTIPFRLAVPYILFTTVPDPWSSGVPALPSFEPSIFQSASNEMSSFERLKASLNYLILYSGLLSGSFGVQGQQSMPSLRELHHRAEMVLVNLEVMCVDYPRVSLPHYQFVGGPTLQQKEKLDPSLANWLNGAPDGVIVVSLGSHPRLQQAWNVLGDKLEDALSRMPKWHAVIQRDVNTRDRAAPVPGNVRYLPWLAQDTLLAHQRTRVFVTHGGNNGQLEAIYHAVPMLTLPVTGDQFYNGLRISKRGYGLALDMRASTADELFTAMMDLASNNTYYKNIRKCSDVLRSQATGPEKVVFWVEHILKFGGSHLRPPTLDMPLYKLFMLDVMVGVVVTALVLFAGFCLCAHLSVVACMNMLKRSKRKEE